MYGSMNYVISGLDNGLSPVPPQAMIRTNADSVFIEPLEHISMKF